MRRRERSGRAVGAQDLRVLQEVRLQDRSDGRELPQRRARSPELAGCDLLTISPDLLKKLADSNDKVERKLSPEAVANDRGRARSTVDESSFRFLVNDDAMATEKLAEGIRTFAADAVKLEKLIEALK